jgi:hypothetical protein
MNPKGIQTMLGILSDFGAYLKAVFVDGIRKVFTLFEVLGIAFYFFPGFDEWLRLNEGLRRSIGGAVILISFILANFSLYRKRATEETSLNESSLLMSPHRRPPYNAVKMQNVASETIKDLKIGIVYRDTNGKTQTKSVEEFYAEGDPRMWQHHQKYEWLSPNQVAYFYLSLQKKNVLNGKVTVSVSFIGAESGKPVQFEQDFELQEY